MPKATPTPVRIEIPKIINPLLPVSPFRNNPSTETVSFGRRFLGGRKFLAEKSPKHWPIGLILKLRDVEIG